MAKKVKPSTDTTATIVVILDESGSMGHLTDATIEKYNGYVKEQAEVGPGSLTLVTFRDTIVKTVREGEPLATTRPITRYEYKPSGGTPLYDAIGITLTKMLGQNHPEKVIIVIITDGEENMSHQFSHPAVRQLIAAARSLDWQIVFLGANVDAEKNIATYGTSRMSTSSWYPTLRGIGDTYSTLTLASTNYRTGQTAAVDMSELGVKTGV